MTHHGVIMQTLTGAGIVFGGAALITMVLWAALWAWEQEWFKIATAWAALITIGGMGLCGLLSFFYFVGSAVLP